jgi:hypothetical protein
MNAFHIKRFEGESSTSKQRKREELERTLNSFFEAQRIQLKTVKGDMLKSYMKKHELISTSEAAVRDVAAILQDKIKSLILKDRNATISNLAFSPSGLDEELLSVLPFLKERAEKLRKMKNRSRKQRADAVDLDIIDDFMHEHCR